jgi:hypothetical protein
MAVSVFIAYSGGRMPFSAVRSRMICLENRTAAISKDDHAAHERRQMTRKSFLPYFALLASAALSAPFAFGQQELAAIRGIAWNSDGRPLAQAQIIAHGADGADRTVMSGADGMFFIDNLKPGAYQVTASKADFLSSSATEALKASQTVHIDFTLAPTPQPPRNRFLRKVTEIFHIKPT